MHCGNVNNKMAGVVKCLWKNVCLYRSLLLAAVFLANFCVTTDSCSQYEFQCNDGQCISIAWRCDSDFDCGDRSDENATLCESAECPSDYFQCERGRKCIPNLWTCDSYEDCSDGTDELNCGSRECKADEFKCVGSNVCISERWKCDQDDDCSDGSDELGCDPLDCNNQTQFRCHNGRCIELVWKCDGDNDCLDMSDEIGCDVAVSHGQHCRSYEFTCTSIRECVHHAWVCDGDFDCRDHSDENTTMCGIKTCPPGHFQCDDGRCIDSIFQCDGVPHCLDSSDEGERGHCETVTECDPHTQFDCSGNGRYCISLDKVCDGQDDCGDNVDERPSLCGHLNDTSCLVDNGGCSQRCIPIRTSHYCDCHRGFKLASDNHTCEDIDECAIPGTCSQRCSNRIGGYTCHCHTGYIMDPVMHRCYATEGAPMLLFANRHDLHLMSLHDHDVKNVFPHLHSAIAVDYHYRSRKIYWSDVASEKIFWTTYYDNGTFGSAVQLVHKDIQTPDGLAVDWVHLNLYWTDTGKNCIEVLSLRNPAWRKLLIADGLDEPRAIVVDPRTQRRHLYWTDWGQVPKIERATLDGTERSVIINTTLEWPNGLTIDYEINKLFWVDAKLHTISSSNLDGTDQKILLMSLHFLKHPFSVAVFEDNLYWSDWETQSILQVDKLRGAESGRYNVTHVVFNLYSPMDVQVYHKLKQPDAVDACERSGCSQLCLPGRQHFTCFCTDNSRVQYILAPDQKTCHYFNYSVSTTTSKSAVPVVTGTSSNFHVAAIVCAILLTVAVFLIVLLLLCRWYHRNARKGLDFDNPVYRHTTTSQFVILQPKNLPSALEPLTSNEI